MISKDKYLKYINNSFPVCFHCLDEIGRQDQRVYEIKAVRVKDYLPNGTNQILFFHEECFTEVAGSTFAMEEVTSGEDEEEESSS